MASWSDRCDWFVRLDGRVDAELEEERTRRARFHRTAAGRWHVIGRPLACAFGHRARHLLGLLAIIVLFTAIKAPHFDLPFTGWHALKYNTYVEPAMYMAELNDPLHYEQRYAASPTNPRGISSIQGLPLMEWGLYATYELLPLSLEVETRLFTHVLGLLTLIFGYLFLRYWLPRPLTLLTLLLLALNPIFGFSTYVTVYDSITMLCTFVSLWALTLYLRLGESRGLFWAGVVLGIGVAVKYSVFLWLAPMSLALIAFRLRDPARIVRDSLLLLVIAGLPLLVTRTAVRGLPEAPVAAVITLLAWLGVFAVVHWLLTRRQELLDRPLAVFRSHPFSLVAVLALSIAVAGGLFWALGLYGFAPNFLTDSTLLFEPRLYKFMLLRQFRQYATAPVFWLAVGVIPLIILLKHGRAKELALAFGIGSVAYWTVASKAMFFHDYYTVIIMATMSLGAAMVVYFAVSFGPRLLRAAVGAALIIWVVPGLLRETTDLLSRHQDISALTEYINTHTEPGDLILHEPDGTGYYTATAIYTGRALVRPQRLLDQGTRKRAREVGLGNALREAGIRFLFTTAEQPSYRDFVPVLTDADIHAPSMHRTDLICQRVGMDCGQLEASYDELDRLVEALEIPAQFTLLDSVGKFRIFSFAHAAPRAPRGSSSHTEGR